MKMCKQILKKMAGRNRERTQKKQNRQQTAGTLPENSQKLLRPAVSKR